MNRFTWKWNKSEIKQDKPVKVFSTFSCGGGSSLGYKRAGFEVVGNVEIDDKINAMYVKNNHPRLNFNQDLREFNARDDLPGELYHLDILDGSPPCTVFSSAGERDKNWGKTKKFREGQSEQRLDDLFFVFLDTVEKLKPKIVIAENVVGLVGGKAKGYVNEIVKRFHDAGYEVQLFLLNSALMDVPQARHRVFFIANNQHYPKLRLNFNNDPIPFGKVRSAKGKPIGEDTAMKKLLDQAKVGDRKILNTAKRVCGKATSYYGQILVDDTEICQTITSGGTVYRLFDRTAFSNEDFINVQTFPQDYDFCGNPVQYVCGMSVPPNMMANIATEVWEQWLK